jgi:hypothetical protein
VRQTRFSSDTFSGTEGVLVIATHSLPIPYFFQHPRIKILRKFGIPANVARNRQTVNYGPMCFLQGINLRAADMATGAQSFSAMAKELLRTTKHEKGTS